MTAPRIPRTKVIAPNIATARSWSGTVLLDEVAFIRNLRELITALLPVISTDKNFKLILATTPPEFDDTHYSLRTAGTKPPEIKFQPRACEGNWYTSESGIRVHRADAFDTALAGKKIYDLKTGRGNHTPPKPSPVRRTRMAIASRIGSPGCSAARLRAICCACAPPRNAALTNVKTSRSIRDADMVPALNWLSNNVGWYSVGRELRRVRQSA